MMMFLPSLLALLALQGSDAFPTERMDRRLKVSDNILNLKRTSVKSDSSRVLLSELAVDATTPLIAVEQGGGYAVDVGLGGDNFTLIFDTGSSDLWVPSSNFQCLNQKGKPVATSKCDFGKLWTGKYQGGKIPDENFNITYGDGEFLMGSLGYEDVTVAGITIDHQEIASVNKGFWEGDGVTSGIIGFAYSTLTSAYRGTNPAKDSNANSVPYTNFIDNAIDQGKIDSLFSIAIERGTNGGGGQVALGGLPTTNFNHDFASTPLEIKVVTPGHPVESKNYTYYTIQPQGVVVNGQSASIDFPMIVDSGTTLLYFPEQLTKAINEAFDPPSAIADGLWENYCNAKPPKVAITIGGKSFSISAAELLLQGELGEDPNTGGCTCGIQASPSSGPFILGDVFLKNVVAVFDIGDSEMRFAPHENY